MALHPVIARDLAAAVGKTLYHALPVAQAREQVKKGYPPRAVPVPVGLVRDMEVPGADGPLTVRIYRPEGAGPAPLVVFFHGSGFTVLDLDSHDDICRRLCVGGACVVASVDYRLAPEHPFPAAPDDCLAATRWLAEHAGELGATPGRLALAGDSAGACLAAVTALRLQQQGGPAAAALVMWYPVTDHSGAGWPSYRSCGQGLGLTAEGMAWFWGHYLADPAQADHPHASVLRAPSLQGLPPTWLLTAEYDVLRDEGEAFALRLAQDGVPVTLRRCLGMNHGFLKYAGVLDEATLAITQACQWLWTTLVGQPNGMPDAPQHQRLEPQETR